MKVTDNKNKTLFYHLLKMVKLISGLLIKPWLKCYENDLLKEKIDISAKEINSLKQDIARLRYNFITLENNYDKEISLLKYEVSIQIREMYLQFKEDDIKKLQRGK